MTFPRFPKKNVWLWGDALGHIPISSWCMVWNLGYCFGCLVGDTWKTKLWHGGQTRFFSASEFKMWAGTKNASYVCLCVWVIHKLEWKIQWIGGNQVTIEKFTTQMHDSPICITQWSPMVCICWAPSGLACTAHWSCVLSNQRWSCFQFESQKDLVCCSNEKVVRQIQNLSTRFRFKSHQFFQLELDTERWKWILFLRMWGDLGPRDGELTVEEYQAHLHVMSSGLMIDPTEMCPLSTYGFCYSKFKCYMMLNVQSLWGLPCFNLGMFPPSAI